MLTKWRMTRYRIMKDITTSERSTKERMMTADVRREDEE